MTNTQATVDSGSVASDTVELGTDVLARHDRVSARLRNRFVSGGTYAVNLVSSPGTGKTELLTQLLRTMHDAGIRVGALVGDCATDNDAVRLAASGAPVQQIVTEGLCHLEAHMVERHLDRWDLGSEPLDFLFVENVGNLVCPSTFDLGEASRIVLLSVTEGEDKPLKYPQIFHSSDLAIITKIDLAEPCEFDRLAALANIDAVHPGMNVVETSAKQQASVDALVSHLVDARNLFLGL